VDHFFILKVFRNIPQRIVNLKLFKYIKNLNNNIMGFGSLQYASFSYIPLFGWILPVLKNSNSFCKYHAKQGFILAVFFVVAAIALNIINIFMPREWRLFRFGWVVLIYFFYLAYLIYCYIAAITVLKGKPFNINAIKKLVDYIEL
jgi:uncharacterized membrane protein